MPTVPFPWTVGKPSKLSETPTAAVTEGARTIADVSHQLRQRIGAPLAQVLRPPGEIPDRPRVRVDPGVVAEGGNPLALRALPPHRLARDPVGRADHLPGLHPAAGQQRA